MPCRVCAPQGLASTQIWVERSRRWSRHTGRDACSFWLSGSRPAWRHSRQCSGCGTRGIEQAELAKRRRTPALKISPSKEHSSPRNTGGTPSSPRSAQQLSFHSENYALQQDLSNLTDQAQRAERTVREIASLNQAFSAALFHQAEQIETLYNQAVEASNHMDMGNVQLRKTVQTNSKSSKWVFAMLVVFSLMLLFFDWWWS